MTTNRASLVALFALSAIATTAAASAVRGADDKPDRSLQKKEGPKVDGKTVGEWVEILQTSTEKKERLMALNALLKAGPKAEAAVPALVETLRDKDSDIVKRAVYALASVGASAVPALTEV